MSGTISSATSALTVEHITKQYPSVKALDDVSINLREGEVHAVIGPNGAGKSTLFGVISGNTAPSAGTVQLGGRDITGQRPDRVARRGLSRCFQVPRLFAGLTVGENMLSACIAAAAMRPGSNARTFLRPKVVLREAVLTLLEEVGMARAEDRTASELPHGDKKRLEFAMALASEPEILLLDEPTAGMSPEETVATVDLIRRLRADRSLSVLLTEHDMSVVFSLAERVSVLNRGSLLVTGEPEQVRNDARVIDVYLGKS